MTDRSPGPRSRPGDHPSAWKLPASDAKFLMWRGEAFSILRRTPFQHRAVPDEATKKLAAKIVPSTAPNSRVYGNQDDETFYEPI
jgi:hypothetical protein